MIKAAKICGEQLALAAQESARQAQKFGAGFRGIVSVTLLKRRALTRLERVRDRAATLAVNLLNLLLVTQLKSLRNVAGHYRRLELSHYWLHAAHPYAP
jgi:hypothetical protein